MSTLPSGDPTVFGNFHSPDILKNALETNLRSEKFNGSALLMAALKLTEHAEFYQTETSQLTADDVIVASGGSGALEISIKALPSLVTIFYSRSRAPLFTKPLRALQLKCKFYNLTPETGWEADLTHLESLIDG